MSLEIILGSSVASLDVVLGGSNLEVTPAGNCLDVLLNTSSLEIGLPGGGLVVIEGGPTGAQGPIGPQGPQGPIGPQGSTGAQGIPGIQGIQGDVGPQGPKGDQGDQGIQGIQGIQGDVGPQGPQGDQGPPGSQEFTGLTDTPAAYTGEAGKVPAVNVGETALEFVEMPGLETSRFSVVAQTVAPSSTFLLSLPLSRTTFKQGYLMMSLPNAAAVSSGRRRFVSTILFSTDPDDATSSATAKVTFAIPGYPSGIIYFFDDWRQQGFRFDKDGQLSLTQWSTASGQLLIRRCWIDAGNLKIEFENTHGSISANLELQGSYHVFG